MVNSAWNYVLSLNIPQNQQNFFLLHFFNRDVFILIAVTTNPSWFGNSHQIEKKKKTLSILVSKKKNLKSKRCHKAIYLFVDCDISILIQVVINSEPHHKRRQSSISSLTLWFISDTRLNGDFIKFRRFAGTAYAFPTHRIQASESHLKNELRSWYSKWMGNALDWVPWNCGSGYSWCRSHFRCICNEL